MTIIRELFGLKPPVEYRDPKVVVAACANPNQLVGMEIEIENLPAAHGPAWFEKNLGRVWDAKPDGSLRGRSIEIVSKPAGIGILIPEIAKFYEITKYTEANFTDRCSIHVHTNVQDLTPEQLATLCLVYSVVEDLLFEFINHFRVDDPNGKYRDTNLYCVPWSQCRMNRKIVWQMSNDINITFRAWQKYTALNLIPVRNLGTVEWRHMHGSADVPKIELWLNLIGSIMKYAKEKVFEDVVKLIKELNDTSAYRQFFTDVLGGYLPYDQKYEAALAAGVINAKYSLIGFKDTKFKPPAKKKGIHELHEDLFAQIENLHGVLVADDVADAPQEANNWAEMAQRAVIPDTLPRIYYPLRYGDVTLRSGERINALYSEGRSQYLNRRTAEVIPLDGVAAWNDAAGLRYVAGYGRSGETRVNRVWRPGDRIEAAPERVLPRAAPVRDPFPIPAQPQPEQDNEI